MPPRLNTIDDLSRLTKSELRDMIEWAQELGPMFDNFISQDAEKVVFPAGWGSSGGRAQGIHASEISGCMRPTVYCLMGEERKEITDPFWKKKFRMGHMIHALVQNDLRRMCDKTVGAMEFDEEVKISPELQEIAAEWDLHSHCDGVISYFDDPSDREPIMRVGVEIKTESANQWDELMGKSKLKPREHHLEQMCVYMRVLDLPLMWSLYYNKSSSLNVTSEPPWLFTFDEEMHELWAKLEKRFKEFHRLAEEQVLPDREEGIKCEFCPFSQVCKPDYLQRKRGREEYKKKWTKKRAKIKAGVRRLRNA